MEFISTLITNFNAYAAQNQFIAGAVSLWGLGVISYVCKGVPTKIFNFIKKMTTTTITITNQNEIFFSFLKWYEDKGYAKKGRYLKITNGMWGHGSLIKSIGYGKHYFWYKRYLIVLFMNKITGTTSCYDRDEITMVKLGRSHKVYDDILKEVNKNNKSKVNFIIKKFSKGDWICSSEQRPRYLHSIFLDHNVKNKLLTHLNNFVDMEQWYLDNGIPYQTGILLYGPPGTGKTSVIKAIAHHLQYSMHILSASSLHDIQSAMFKLPEKSLIIIEDVDTNISNRDIDYKALEDDIVGEEDEGNNSTIQPVEVPSKPSKSSNIKEHLLKFDFNNLSDILNAIDGVQTNHGRILILTTNDISKLDSALIRPGRIDLILKIGYVNDYILKQFFSKFYPDFKFPEVFKIKNNISSAKVQNLILENLSNPEVVLNKLKC